MNEDMVQQNVVKLLRAYGRSDISWFAVPNGEQRSRMTGARLKAQGVRAGAPDMVLLIDSVFHGVELKTVNGRPSPLQIAFGDEIMLAGGQYHICHGLEETVDHLHLIGAFRPNINFKFPTEADGRSGVRERPWKKKSRAASTKTAVKPAPRRRRASRVSFAATRK